MSEIVIGYDGSDCAQVALDKAVELAGELGDRVVIVFGYGAPGAVGGEMQSHADAIRERAEAVTGEAVKKVDAAGVKNDVELVEEHPFEALINVAADRKARMIVVGSHGESPLKGAVLGSTAHKLVQLSETPVLVVRA